jgi:hypothetical protein
MTPGVPRVGPGGGQDRERQDLQAYPGAGEQGGPEDAGEIRRVNAYRCQPGQACGGGQHAGQHQGAGSEPGDQRP